MAIEGKVGPKSVDNHLEQAAADIRVNNLWGEDRYKALAGNLASAGRLFNKPNIADYLDYFNPDQVRMLEQAVAVFAEMQDEISAEPRKRVRARVERTRYDALNVIQLDIAA